MRSEPGVLIGPIVPAGSGGHRVDDAASDRSPTLRAGIVGFLERLQPDDAKYPFTCLPGAIGYRGPGGSLTTHCTNRNLNKFVDWINSYCAAHRRADFIPPRRHRWKLMSTGQFRTLAWFIARQPGGALNGAQYKDACCRVASNTGKQTYSNDCTIQGWSCGARIRDGRNALRHTAPAAAPTSAAARLWWVALNAYAVERITRIAPTTAGRARWRSAPRPH